MNKQEIRLSLDGFQSTPPRGRRPAFPFFEAAVRDISIHASAREATSRTFSLRPISHDFNPRLREGGDRLPLAILLESCHFNPRLREGGDSCMPFSCGSVPYISIHASAREATIFPHILRGGWRISIHASAREATCCEEYKENTNPFQSTPPRGRRL